MKSKLYLFTAVIFLVLFSCKVKQKDAPASSSVMLPLINVAQNKFPGITQADLDEGQNIFSNDCARCHDAPKINSRRSEAGWKKVIDWMAPKAKLNEIQTKKLMQFVLSSYEQQK